MDLKHHAADDALEGYVMRTLSNLKTEQLEMHLLVCQPCRERLDRTEEFVVAMRAAAATTGNQRPGAAPGKIPLDPGVPGPRIAQSTPKTP